MRYNTQIVPACTRSQVGAGQRAQRAGSYPEAACHLVLCGLRIGRGAQAVECGLEDWLEVAGVAVDRGDGDDHVEGSLHRLQTDWIDLYQVGVPDPDTDIDETLGALSDLMHAGKIRAFGASKVPASEIVEAQWTADRRGHGRFRTEQPPYSILTRAIEYDVLPTCLRHGMGVMTYSPLAGGWLSGTYRKGQQVSGPGSAARAERFPALYDAPFRRR